jgi:electron transport complex protein RnfD
MLDVLIALIPVTVAAIILFGYTVAVNVILCAAFCYVAELLYDLIFSKSFTRDGVKKSSCHDLSCLVTGVLLGLNLPPYLEVWGLNIYAGGKIAFSFDTLIACLIGSIFAIVVAKKLFGGIGRNIVNPALSGRVFLVMCFGAGFAAKSGVFDATTSATWLSSKSQIDGSALLNMLVGNTGSAAVGETCAIALIIAYAYLVIRRVIDWRLPIITIASTAVFALLFDGVIKGVSGDALWLNTLAHVLSGGLIFGAVFMVTDYATNPNTVAGRLIFGAGVGLITVLIRVYASYPEGVSFAILIMNIFTPLIDRYVYPRPFGARRGK